MRMTSRVLGPAAAAAALLIASAGLAQEGGPAAGAEASVTQEAAAQGATTDPHRLLDDLSGGPQGSPTAQRGNPQPGTSTSIPTANPATVRPLEQRGGGNENVAVKDTGLEGQCDPVVSIGCPEVADQLQPGTTAARADAGTAAQPATGMAAESGEAAN